MQYLHPTEKILQRHFKKFEDYQKLSLTVSPTLAFILLRYIIHKLINVDKFWKPQTLSY